MSSSALFKESVKHFPGGVNSPVRFYKPSPVFMASGKGSRIRDVEGNDYIDYSLGFGPMIIGHSNEEFNVRLKRRIENGILFGAPSAEENSLAEKISEAIPSIKKMRFTNSGTEATMHAIRVARGFTGRNIILKMEGGYHGAHDYSLIKSGSGTLTFGTPSSPGIPPEVSRTVALGQYNDLESVKKIFNEMGSSIAAVITEPVMGNVGLVPPEEGFLEGLREICEKHSSLLIFDEVITGFRYGFHGYQDLIGVKPDLTTLGKIIGGGTPIGLLGGRDDVMDRVTPSGNIYEAGTFSGNPLSTAAGNATLEILKQKNYSPLIRRAEKLATGISEIADRKSAAVTVNQSGPMFQMFYNASPVRRYSDAASSDANAYFNMFSKSLNHGVYLQPSQFETNFLGFEHSDGDVVETLKVLEDTLI